MSTRIGEGDLSLCLEDERLSEELDKIGQLMSRKDLLCRSTGSLKAQGKRSNSYSETLV